MSLALKVSTPSSCSSLIRKLDLTSLPLYNPAHRDGARRDGCQPRFTPRQRPHPTEHRRCPWLQHPLSTCDSYLFLSSSLGVRTADVAPFVGSDVALQVDGTARLGRLVRRWVDQVQRQAQTLLRDRPTLASDGRPARRTGRQDQYAVARRRGQDGGDPSQGPSPATKHLDTCCTKH